MVAHARALYAPTVILPRRIKAELFDSTIASAIAVVPALIGQGLADRLPDLLLRLFWLGIPAAILYVLFRDAVGRGTSWGKRALGLRIIDVTNGAVCGRGQVWARNLLDVIPVINFIDFIWMCVDKHGQKWMDRWLGTQVVEESDIGRWSADAIERREASQPLPPRWLTTYTCVVVGIAVLVLLSAASGVVIGRRGPLWSMELGFGLFLFAVAVGLLRRKAWAWKANFALLCLPALPLLMVVIISGLQRLALLKLAPMIIGSGLWIWPNVVYFRKRRHLFCR